MLVLILSRPEYNKHKCPKIIEQYLARRLSNQTLKMCIFLTIYDSLFALKNYFPQFKQLKS